MKQQTNKTTSIDTNNWLKKYETQTQTLSVHGQGVPKTQVEASAILPAAKRTSASNGAQSDFQHNFPTLKHGVKMLANCPQD